jgi:hypothetical protein
MDRPVQQRPRGIDDATFLLLYMSDYSLFDNYQIIWNGGGAMQRAIIV